MKLCELKIQDYEDRMRTVAILANAGYKVSITVREIPDEYGHDYFVIVEDNKEVKNNDWAWRKIFGKRETSW